MKETQTINFNTFKAEIESVLQTGTSPSSIIYAHPCKPREFVSFAKEVGVEMMTFDNEEELFKIHQLFPRAKLVVRLKVDDSHSKFHLSAKFGVTLKAIPRLLQLAQSLGLDVIGVSFHVGSECDSADVYSDALRNVRRTFDLARSFGYQLTLVDIGGGFPGGSDSSQTLLFDSIAHVVGRALDEFFPINDYSNVQVIAEPGRYYVQSALTLTSMIISKRVDEPNIESLSSGPTIMYYINDGIYGSFSNTTFGAEELCPIPEICESSLNQRKLFSSMIWGPTCDSIDVIRSKICFPEMEVGEWMTFTNMGAYTLALATKFHGFDQPLVKCHATIDAIKFLSQLHSWPRLIELMGNYRGKTKCFS